MSCLNQIIAERVRGKLNVAAEVRVEPLDFGNQLGVAVAFGGRRHAVRAKIDQGDLTEAADTAVDALNDWISVNG